MPIPSSINDLSTTAGSNSPGGSESPSLIDNYFRTYASYIAQLRDGMQGNAFNYAAAGGTANAITASYSPAVTTLSDSTVLLVKAAAVNTGAVTFSPDGLTAKPIVGLAHGALQGGEIAVNGDICLQYNTSVGGGSWVLVYSSGNSGQTSQIIGGSSNVKMTVAGASATATLTASEVVVKAALGGQSWVLASLSKAINLAAANGAGAMDTGAAPVSGWVAIYAIYNPSTGVSALLGVNSPNTLMPEVYGGANMPSGFIGSALLTVVPTNASGLIKICSVRGRKVGLQIAQAYTVTGSVANQVVTPTTVIPANAIEVFGELQVGSTAASALSLAVFSDTANINQQILAITVGAGQTVAGNFSGLMITTPQQFVASSSSTGGAPTLTVYFSGYWI